MKKVDKSFKNKTIKDLAREIKGEDIDFSEVNTDFQNVVFDFDEAFNEKIKTYNANITDFGKYDNLVPRGKILVRVFAKELKISTEGLVMPNLQKVAVPTKSGVGTIGEVENPYVYSKKAVVVAVPKYVEDLKKYDVVQLSEEPTRGIPVGAGNAVAIVIPNSFIHCQSDLNKAPEDPSSEDYGYLLVDSRFIEVIL